MSAVATQATVPDAPSSRRRALLPGLVLAVVALGPVRDLRVRRRVLAWQFHAGNLMAVSAGLGALLCLERRDRRGDLAVADLRARAGRVDVFVRRYAAQRCGG